MQPVSLAIVGAGGRGAGYATFAAAHPDRARVVAVAEPRDRYREQVVAKYGVAADLTFTDWRDLAERPRLADAAIIATQDAMHVGPAVALAAKGYHILLEKPMAPDEAGCRQIVAAALEAGTIFAVCHVMRYTAYTRTLKRLLDDGRIGEVVSIQHLEPVGHWHQAHSFVRGNWGNEAASSPMLLAKSCHDLDWLRHVMGEPCQAIQSFGSLKHFRASEKPAGAADRCLDCRVEA
ncbi:MAG: Gfo/Idh/MocA family oxidoreductase, partial [Gemmatimonadota bacterium]